MRFPSILFILIAFLFSCKTQQNISSKEEDYLLRINGTTVSVDEFLYAYQKSNENSRQEETVEDYLDLYIDFKLKVEAAKAEGIDTTKAFKEELNQYLSDIKKPYLINEQVKEELLKETYERLKTEVNASHILISIPEDPSPQDTLSAYNRMLEIREKALNDSSFSALAMQYSEDPSAKFNKGNLGWFTAFQMVYPFEQTAYNTAVGEISKVIRTQFGYHILKVHDKRETQGRIKIAHLMLRYPPNADRQDSLITKNKIEDIKNRLESGESWFKLVAQYSEDLNTKDMGGVLPWFQAGNLPKEMEEAAFSLEVKGDLSSVVESPYGLHIIKLEEKRGVGSFESMRESLIYRIKRDGRSDLKLEQVIRKLKLENNFQKNAPAYVILKQRSSFSKEDYSNKEQEMILFYIADQRYSVLDFLKSNPENQEMDAALEAYEDEEILAYENNHLEEKYPKFKYLSQEYYDGLLLFEIMSRKIWSLPGKDTAALGNYYERHKSNYVKPKTYVVDVIQFNDSSYLERYSIPINGLYPYADSIPIENLLNGTVKIKPSEQPIAFQLMGKSDRIHSIGDSIYNILQAKLADLSELEPFYSNENKVYLRLLSEANNLLVTYQAAVNAAWSDEYVTDHQIKGVTVSDNILKKAVRNDVGEIQWVRLRDTKDAQPLSFEDAKVEVIADYQKEAERKWLDSLKEINDIYVNTELLQKVKKELADK